jgi:prepilin-type N-terminal cleavage/methylation domain-containing protein
MMNERSKAGYSLVEVLIALAITSVVLLTVVPLFYMGRRNVYSGKQMTYAVSVGTRMLEDLSTMAMSDLVGSGTGSVSYFNIDNTTALNTVTINGIGPGAAAGGVQSFTNSIKRDSTACTASGTPPVYTCPDDTPASDPNAPKYLAKWRSLIDDDKLANAELGIVITPRWVAGQTQTLDVTTFLKVRAYVAWDEAKNRRRVAFFDTTKVNRQ